MRKLIVSTFVSLDGVMQAPDQPDPEGGFPHGGWAFGYWDEVVDDALNQAMKDPFDLLLGRRTYEVFAGFWPTSDQPAAGPINAATKYVASRTLKSVEWQNSRLLEGPLADAVGAIKAQDGPDVVVQGSADLIQSLLADRLIDEFRVWTFPVLLGEGQRLFEAGTPAGGLEIVESKASPSGVVMTHYCAAGDIKASAFG